MYWCLLKSSDVRLWSLSSKLRLERMLKFVGPMEFLEDIQDLPVGDSVLILRGDFLFDERVLHTLTKRENVVFQVQLGTRTVPVAAHVPAAQAAGVYQALEEEILPRGEIQQVMGLEDLSLGFSKKLKKSDTPYVLPVHSDKQIILEELLFSGSYKGVTDLVTKFLWPVPAKWVTRFCAMQGIRPNHVTALSLIFTVGAGVLFWKGYLAWGLVLGWIMTFLDTVDGKLARVTVTSTRWGNIFDHGIDLIHPPLWYVAWGLGLSSFSSGLLGVSLETLFWIIFGGYILGRFVEGIFHRWVAGFGIFCWRPVDSFYRLVTARRNPNLILLTGSLVFGRPDLGLEAVAIWTALSTLILLGRLAMGMLEKNMKGSLTSWLAEIDPVNGRDSLAVRLFTNPPATIK